MAQRATSSRWVPFAAVALAAAAVAAAAQDPGDRVVVTLRNGKTYEGTLVEKTEENVVLKVGGSDVSLPAGLVTGVARAAAAPTPAPAPAAPAGKTGAAPAAASPAGGGPPKNAVILKNGTLLEGYALSRDEDGTVWFIEGVARPLPASEVDEVMGEVGSGGSGLVFTGNATKDALRLVKELGSKEGERAKTAAALLEQYGKDAEPALIKGLSDDNGIVRRKALGILRSCHTDASLGPILQVLKNDVSHVVRASAAGILADWNSPRVRGALLEAAWRDREDSVKMAAIGSVKKQATLEEASGLMDLLLVLPPESEARSSLFEALRKATGLRTTDDAALWITWWNEKGGREDTFAKVNKILEERAKAEYGGGR